MTTTTNRPLVIFHGGCPDGVFAAAIAREFYGNLSDPMLRCTIDEHAATHGTPLPLEQWAGRRVFLLDWCPPENELLRLLEIAGSVTLFDHHETAAKILDSVLHVRYAHLRSHFQVCLDVERSGCQITWDELFGEVQRPELIDLIGDRDLWRFQFGMKTRNVYNAVTSFTLTDNDIVDQLLWHTDVDVLNREGAAISRFRDQLIADAVSRAQLIRLGDYTIPVTNCPYTIGSDVAGNLAYGQPFAGYWWVAADGTEHWGLRSEPDGLNVADIAAKFGGGGHPHAAGFRLNQQQGTAFRAGTTS